MIKLIRPPIRLDRPVKNIPRKKIPEKIPPKTILTEKMSLTKKFEQKKILKKNFLQNLEQVIKNAEKLGLKGPTMRSRKLQVSAGLSID